MIRFLRSSVISAAEAKLTVVPILRALLAAKGSASALSVVHAVNETEDGAELMLVDYLENEDAVWCLLEAIPVAVVLAELDEQARGVVEPKAGFAHVKWLGVTDVDHVVILLALSVRDVERALLLVGGLAGALVVRGRRHASWKQRRPTSHLNRLRGLFNLKLSLWHWQYRFFGFFLPTGGLG